MQLSCGDCCPGEKTSHLRHHGYQHCVTKSTLTPLDNPTSSANWVHEICEEMDDGSPFLASQEKKRCSENFGGVSFGRWEFWFEV